jgi:hypothetical protein
MTDLRIKEPTKKFADMSRAPFRGKIIQKIVVAITFIAITVIFSANVQDFPALAFSGLDS